MVAPIGPEKMAQRLVKLVRTADGVTTEDIIPVRFVPMVEGMPDEPAPFSAGRASAMASSLRAAGLIAALAAAALAGCARR